jgi:hypothetical protein
MRSNGSPHPSRGRIMTLQPGTRRSPYLRVPLRAGGQQKYVSVHRLVLEAFVGACPDGLQACHFDDNPTNNHLSNLRWDTPSANMYDKVRNGHHHLARRTHCKRGHAFDETNTRINRRGGRACRQCVRDSFRRCRDRQTVAQIPGELPGQIPLFEAAAG